MSEINRKFQRHQLDTSFTLTGLKRTVRLGMKSLWLHRLRSLLTVLGIVFGVCSVISMLAIGEGASHETQEQIRQLGASNIILRSVKPPENQSATQERSRALSYGLKYNDVSQIQATIPGVTVVVPGRIIREAIWNGGRKVNGDIVGTVPWYPEMRKHHVAEGRFFTEMEHDSVLNVCVLGQEIVNELFPIGNPIGQSVRIGSAYYRVLGIMEPGGTSGAEVASGQDSGGGSINRIYIPLSAARDRFGETLIKRGSGSFQAEVVELHEATVQVASQDDVIEVSQIVKDMLQRSHDKQDYEVVVPLQLLQQAERTKQIFNIVLGAIAAISLIVGGIGIMNIMLASVTERTREIGIRRALGAKKRDIVVQFLIETVILSGAGGVIGVVLGVTIPFFITWFADMVTIVTIWSPAIAFSISALIGVIFGIYPAVRAAEMDPVEALRHE